MSGSLYGLFGGTFDPMHNGHLDALTAVLHTCRLKEVCWIPTGIPAYRSRPFAAAIDRYRMVRLALENYPQMHISDIETGQHSVAYTYDTIAKLKSLYPERSFCFILGLDALLNLESWHRWEELLEAVHFIVMERPGLTRPSSPPNWWQSALADSMDDLRKTASGLIFEAAITPCTISSSEIRHCLANGIEISHLVPKAVWDYIRAHQLYEYDSS